MPPGLCRYTEFVIAADPAKFRAKAAKVCQTAAETSSSPRVPQAPGSPHRDNFRSESLKVVDIAPLFISAAATAN
ncbi:hypothetical protein JR064_05280 [Xanthomonas sp. CFBP 8703]|jgi:hypothetical protein|uniref:Uncharacterized protein n=1 Tax=Xanthomonas bonasiae TaxID=2810351 RepID=A0ABS3AYY7_9XANT|nr:MULTISPECIES: hypothetical protein [Xanthomonas]MBD7920851.1 hypothetical protein [Xanthomonas surreyensis]MBN6101573.1 hypothetical protein [Xanthomonas bonasiae]MBN6111833.1 hypothetical protein [Xanthomonas bonasiae]